GRWRGPHAVDREREHFLVARLQRAQVQSGYREALLGGLGRTVGELRIQAAARRGKAIAPGSVEALQPGVQCVRRGRVANREPVAELAVQAAQLPGQIVEESEALLRAGELTVQLRVPAAQPGTRQRSRFDRGKCS